MADWVKDETVLATAAGQSASAERPHLRLPPPARVIATDHQP